MPSKTLQILIIHMSVPTIETESIIMTLPRMGDVSCEPPTDTVEPVLVPFKDGAPLNGSAGWISRTVEW
jgi:hypothetical protein